MPLVVDRNGHLDAHGLIEGDAVIVEVAHRPVHPGGDARQLRAGAALGLLHVDARRVQHGVAPVLAEDLLEVGDPHAAHGDHGLHVLQRAVCKI